jgi:hypothetical protein
MNLRNKTFRQANKIFSLVLSRISSLPRITVLHTTTLTKPTESAHNDNVKLQMWVCGVDPDGDTTVL